MFEPNATFELDMFESESSADATLSTTTIYTPSGAKIIETSHPINSIMIPIVGTTDSADSSTATATDTTTTTTMICFMSFVVFSFFI